MTPYGRIKGFKPHLKEEDIEFEKEHKQAMALARFEATQKRYEDSLAAARVKKEQMAVLEKMVEDIKKSAKK